MFATPMNLAYTIPDMWHANKDRQKRYIFQSYHLTETLKLKDVAMLFASQPLFQSSTKLVYAEGEDRYVFIYRFGSVTLFNIEPIEHAKFIEKISTLIEKKPNVSASDEFSVELDASSGNKVGFSSTLLDKISFDRVEILAFILAQSTALEYFELRVDDMLLNARDIGLSLKKHGRLVHRSSSIKKFIGQCIATKQELITSLELLDKPEKTWNDQVLYQLHQEASEQFEIRERYRTTDYKLKMLQENLVLIAELLEYRQANFLELAIIALIAFEIILFIWQMFIMK